jgi:hypothetical protein
MSGEALYVKTGDADVSEENNKHHIAWRILNNDMKT